MELTKANHNVRIVNCPSNYPQKTHTVELWRETKPNWRRISTGVYDPKIGFVLKDPIEVVDREIIYRCVAKGTEDFVIVKYVRRDNENSIERNKPLSFYFPAKAASFFCDVNRTIAPNIENEDISLQSVKCDNPYDCQLAKDCFKEGRDCRDNVLNGITCRSGNCSVVRQSHFSGHALCTAKEYQVSNSYFLGLNVRRYTMENLDSIPERALIPMDAVAPVLYSDEPVFVFCEASSFLFMTELTFTIGYKNGTTTALPQGTYTISDEKQYEDEQSIGAVQRRLNLNVTEDMEQIHCLAAWYNSSTAWYFTSRNLNVKNPLAASIVKTNLKQIFYKDGTERNLLCTAFGQPPPEFRWLHNDTDITSFASIPVSSGDRMESYMKFTIIDESIEGTYTCQVSNRLGNDSANFNVRVEGIPS